MIQNDYDLFNKKVDEFLPAYLEYLPIYETAGGKGAPKEIQLEMGARAFKVWVCAVTAAGLRQKIEKNLLK